MIKKVSGNFQAADGAEIYFQVWKDEEIECKGLFQIIHGYAEWVDRYDEFASFLAGKGFVVFGEDHRGHGHTRGEETRTIHYADQNGFEKVVDDNHKLAGMMRGEYPRVPMFLFGHSMGSFLTRRYMQKYGDELKAVVICGTGNNPMISLKAANYLAKKHIKKKGVTYPDAMLDKMVFGNLNKNYEPSETGLEWCCRDTEVIQSFYEEPLRGLIATSAFFRDFTQGMIDVQTAEKIDRIPKNLPVLFVSGEKDPVGGKDASGVKKAYHAMKKAGMKDVSIKIYEGARHELLNEFNKEQVASDIEAWIQHYMA